MLFLCSSKRLVHPRNGTKKTKNSVHEAPNTRIRKRISLQPLPDASPKNRNRAHLSSLRKTNKNLVPEQKNEMEERQQTPQHKKRKKKDKPSRSHHNRKNNKRKREKLRKQQRQTKKQQQRKYRKFRRQYVRSTTNTKQPISFTPAANASWLASRSRDAPGEPRLEFDAPYAGPDMHRDAADATAHYQVRLRTDGTVNIVMCGSLLMDFTQL